jgi:hypothetical protein
MGSDVTIEVRRNRPRVCRAGIDTPSLCVLRNAFNLHGSRFGRGQRHCARARCRSTAPDPVLRDAGGPGRRQEGHDVERVPTHWAHQRLMARGWLDHSGGARSGDHEWTRGRGDTRRAPFQPPRRRPRNRLGPRRESGNGYGDPAVIGLLSERSSATTCRRRALEWRCYLIVGSDQTPRLPHAAISRPDRTAVRS